MPKPKSVVNPGAGDVRAFYRANSARFERLTEAAQRTVREGARGQLHPSVIADYNKGRKSDRQYVRGASGIAKAAAKAEAVAAREALRAQGVKVGARGPLPKPTL